jgi:cation-transporting ATPase E
VTAPGLGAEEVRERLADGRANIVTRSSSRSLGSILRANVFTRFNAIIGVLFVVVIVFGPIQDGLFGLVIVVNSAVGIVQELRAKRTLDALALLEESPVRLRRDGSPTEAPPRGVVVDDVVLLAAGEKVPVDGEVIEADGLELDESLLTGEADPVAKRPGDTLRSGSFVVAGSGAFRAVHVGDDAYANRLVAQARRFELSRSELMTGINRILRVIQWIIVPLGVLLVISQLLSTGSFAEAMVGTVAGVVPMIPEGLVLMTSVAFAVGVIRLAQRRCLVQELPAIETLARVDLLCLDKTGTLTAPEMDLSDITMAPGTSTADDGQARAAIAALARVEEQPNATMRAIADALEPAEGWVRTAAVPFSSSRKYSAAAFDQHGAWCLGAPDVILAPGQELRAEADRLAATGLRVLALGELPDGALPGPAPRGDALPKQRPPAGAALEASPPDILASGVRPRALVVLRQRLRPEAPQTMSYLIDEGITLKIFSGDNASSVGAVASAAGIPGGDRPVDARTLPDAEDDADALTRELDRAAVFGRVTPEQKRAFVTALRRSGHTVGMTGDGVNDALALKDADLGIAMGSGSAATRGVAKIVLMDNSFAAMPRVLAEGRRVLGNIERVASLFLTKTAYSLVLAALVGLAHVPYPLLPRHTTLVGSLTIGIPGFFLALAPNSERWRPGFVSRVLRRAAPAGLVCGVAAFVAYGLARLHSGTGEIEDRSTAALTLFVCAAWVLALAARPYTRARVALIATMVGAFVLAAVIPFVAEFFALDLSDSGNVMIGLATAGVGILAISIVHRDQRVVSWLETRALRAWRSVRDRVADPDQRPDFVNALVERARAAVRSGRDEGDRSDQDRSTSRR